MIETNKTTTAKKKKEKKKLNQQQQQQKQPPPTTQATQAVYQISLDVTLAHKRCCVTKIRFLRACMGTQRFCFKSQLFLYFVNKIYLSCYCNVFFVLCQLLRPT